MVSAVIGLYSVSTAKYLGSYADDPELIKLLHSKEADSGDKIKAILKAKYKLPLEYTGPFDEADQNVIDWCDDQAYSEWSDHNKHIAWHIRGNIGKGKDYHRLNKKINTFRDKVCCFRGKEYLALDAVTEDYGWFLRNSFLDKNNPIMLCNTKKQMENFLRKQICYRGASDQLVAMVQKYKDEWKDGMLFIAAF